MELSDIRETYDSLTYFDQYSASVFLFICLLLIFIWCIVYLTAQTMAQPIKDDWATQRCHPMVLPVAGWIHHPEGTTAFAYTGENFQYCMQTILSGVAGSAVNPLTFTTSLLHSVFSAIQSSIQGVRGMFDKVRTSMQTVAVEIMGRLLNIMTPIIRMLIAFKDITGKIQGTATASLFTFMGSYFALKSLMGVIAQSILEILIALSVMIAVFWAVPFTWGAAVANTSIFVAIAVPMAVILSFMSNTMNVRPGLRIPKLKCFHPDTLVEMNDRQLRAIRALNPGDRLRENNEVLAVIELTTINSRMFSLGGVIVSDSHQVATLDDRRVCVGDLYEAVPVFCPAPTIFCLVTSNKAIPVANSDYIYCDWDDCTWSEWEKRNKPDTELVDDIGFSPDTLILSKRGPVAIYDIAIGEQVAGGDASIVYGKVNLQTPYGPKLHLLVSSGVFLYFSDESWHMSFDYDAERG
jgi:hypothetical protein